MMNYQAQILYSHILLRTNPPKSLSPHFTSELNPRKALAHNQKQTVLSTIANETQVDAMNVNLKTLGGCKLGISRYPDFDYDAAGGSGNGRVTPISDDGNEVFVDFDVNTLCIPAVSSGTTKFLGLSLPPFLNIDIVPEMLSGKINQESGQVDLRLKAEFWFSIGSMYRAAPLVVDTVLTSEEASGDMRRGRGVRLNKESGSCTLVGVARVDPIGDLFMDSFLSLPSECLACLQATISFVN